MPSAAGRLARRPKMTSTAITAANGSIWMTSVGISTPATCRAVVIDRQAPKRSGAEEHPDGPAARQHGEHDADEAGAVGHERDEDARRPTSARKAPPMPARSAGREHGEAARAQHVDAGGVERRRLVAGRLQVEAEIGVAVGKASTKTSAIAR